MFRPRKDAKGAKPLFLAEPGWHRSLRSWFQSDFWVCHKAIEEAMVVEVIRRRRIRLAKRRGTSPMMLVELGGFEPPTS